MVGLLGLLCLRVLCSVFYLDILLVDFCLILFCGLLVSCAGCLFGVASWFAWGVWCGGFCCAVVLLWVV